MRRLGVVQGIESRKVVQGEGSGQEAPMFDRLQLSEQAGKKSAGKRALRVASALLQGRFADTVQRCIRSTDFFRTYAARYSEELNENVVGLIPYEFGRPEKTDDMFVHMVFGSGRPPHPGNSQPWWLSTGDQCGGRMPVTAEIMRGHR